MPWACPRCGTVYALELSGCPRCPDPKENTMPKNTVHGGDTYEDGAPPPSESVYENPHDPRVIAAKRQADAPVAARPVKADVEDGPKDEKEPVFKQGGEENAPASGVKSTDDAGDSERPGDNAAKGEWVAYARAKFPNAKSLELKTKAELIALCDQG